MEQMADRNRTLRPIRQVLYGLRWAIIVFVLVAASQVHFVSAYVHRKHILYSVATIAFVTIAFQLAAGKLKWLKRPILAFIADVLLVSVVIYFSDGIQSPFYPLYYITVIMAAVDFGLYGALEAAFIIAVLSLGIDAVAPGHKLTQGVIPEDLVSTVPYLFLIAIITGALRSRIRVLDDTASRLRADRAATEREMEIASRVQKAQLPLETPSLQGIRIATTYKPAREVGGDLYDFYPVEKDSIGLIVADVSGKGVPAALLVSSSKYAVRENLNEDKRRMMCAINEHLLSVTTDETFVTMLYGTLLPKTRQFRYVNAGHMPPMVIKGGSGEVIICEHSDPPLGVIRQCGYVERCIDLERGDTLVLYTDGVTDGLSSSGDGVTVFREFLAGVAKTELSTWGEALLRRIANPQHLDDLTMVAVRVE